MLKLNFSPFPVLKTSRLLLRQVQEADAAEILFLRSDEQVMEFIDRERTQTEADAIKFIKTINTAINNNESILWGIALSENPDNLIGTICFWNIQAEHYRAETGYLLHPGYWGKGIMKEALLAVIDFGFTHMNLHSIKAMINPANNRSGILLEKTGFVKEAYFREDYFFRGKFLDTAVYSILAP